MATGYTMDIHNGKPVTFEQFALKCSRAMGAAIMQRDESLDAEIRMRELDEYYVIGVTEARTALEAALARTDTEWADMQATEIAEASKVRDEYIRDTDALYARYRDMQEQVEAWEPPTDDHMGLKKFMLDQFEESIRFDVGRPGEKRYIPHVPEEVPVYVYKARHLTVLAQRQAEVMKRLSDECDRVRSQNEWVTALRDSLAQHGKDDHE